MTRPAQPEPYPGDSVGAPLPGTVLYRHEYRDALGRPMTGHVIFTGTTRHDTGDTSFLVAPVTVKLVAGVVAVDLPPDTYQLAADLRTIDGGRVADKGTLTLP